MITERLKKILTDLNIDKHTIEQFDKEKISAFFDTFLKNNTFLTRKALTGDFLNLLGFNVYRGANNISDLRRVLSYSFTYQMREAIKEGKIEKYNNSCYKVKQNGKIKL